MLSAAIAKRRLVLDGGLGMELEKRVPVGPLAIKKSPLWSAKVLIEQPLLITAIHKDYVDAGADVLLTATYQASYAGLKKHANMSLKQSQELWETAIQCCVDAKCGIIGGSVGPYGAFLANGAEYSGVYGDVDLKGHHRDMVEYFVKHPQVDVVAFETIPNINEIKAIIELMEEFDKEYYVALSCKNGSELADGTPLSVVSKLLANSKNLVATGCNCVPFENVTAICEQLSGPLIVYPNYGFSNDMSDPSQYSFKAATSEWETAVGRWLENDDIKVIGGCCSTGPQEIAIVTRALRPKTGDQ